MYLSIDFDSLLTQNIEDIILWFEEEFDLIFKNIENFTNYDINLGSLIIDNLVKILKAYHNKQVLDLLIPTLCNIREKYPDLF